MAHTKESGMAKIEGKHAWWINGAKMQIRRQLWHSPSVASDTVMWHQKPPHPNCVGVVFSSLAKDGILKRSGFRPSLKPSANRRIIATWDRIEY
jgi:hypothetical protein